MTGSPSALDATEQALRGKRLVQISSLTMLGLAILASRALLTGRWTEACVMGAGIAMMLLCQALNRRGGTDTANLLLVLALTAMVSVLMWRGEGLRDSALLAFPAVLISAGLLIRPAHVPRLLFAMVLVVMLLPGASLMGLRVDSAPDELIDRTVDVTLILLISGFAVWVMMGDLHNALGRLSIQIAQYAQSQQEQLARLGCTQGQGYLFARPMAAPEFETLVLGRLLAAPG